MTVNWNYVFGITTVTLIVGGTIYAIVKAKKIEKEEEGAISLAEAREIVEKDKLRKERMDRQVEEGYLYPNIDRSAIINKRNEDMDEEYEEFGEMMEDIRDQASWNASFMPNEDTVEEHGTRKIQAVKSSEIILVEEDDEEGENDDLEEKTPDYTVEPLKDFNYYEEGIDPKEDKELRYNPNSVEAKHQFIRMELADWDPDHDVYRIMIQLFEFPFIPTTEGDEILRTQIIDYKVQFFGFNSRWNKEVSFADVIFHYARAAEFNCGETVSYWVEHFLDFNEFTWDSSSRHIDTLLLRLNSHTYFNEERQTFGLFGLTREGMDQAIRIANRSIDRSVTYEIEFNEFLKSCL